MPSPSQSPPKVLLPRSLHQRLGSLGRWQTQRNGPIPVGRQECVGNTRPFSAISHNGRSFRTHTTPPRLATDVDGIINVSPHSSLAVSPKRATLPSDCAASLSVWLSLPCHKAPYVLAQSLLFSAAPPCLRHSARSPARSALALSCHNARRIWNQQPTGADV